MNRHVKTGPSNATPPLFYALFTHVHIFSSLGATCYAPNCYAPSLPTFTNSSQLVSLASGWKRVSPKKPAEKSPACAKPNRG